MKRLEETKITDSSIEKTETGHRCELTVSSSSLFMLHVVWSIVVGFIVGLIASAIMHTHLGFVGTTLLGIVGSMIGGLIARLFSKPPAGSENPGLARSSTEHAWKLGPRDRLRPAGAYFSIINESSDTR